MNEKILQKHHYTYPVNCLHGKYPVMLQIESIKK